MSIWEDVVLFPNSLTAPRPRVYDKRSAPADAIYVGRPSKWGNPYVIGPHGTRAEVIAAYREYLLRQPALMSSLDELRGRNLSCWCAPKPCHADILLELANRPKGV